MNEAQGMRDAMKSAIRELDRILNAPRPRETFRSEVNGTAVVSRGETEFMTRKEAERVISEVTKELCSLRDVMSAAIDDGLAAARSPQTTAEPST